ncbi:hypothetical protein [Candidatus Ruminimicrobiellum ovillum]|uniref:hypothetical protein n=1 Tax=Candidatus Ruminimicrobiellum ovillum TaxID=1947927 RepID=UPI00355AA59D
MKKKLFVAIVLLLCFCAYNMPLFAATSAEIKKEIKKDAKNSAFTFVTSNDDDCFLYKDSKGNFYLYYGNWLFDYVVLYGKSELVSKEEVATNMKKSSESEKIVEGEYTIYKVDMGFLNDTFYYVRTPKGNFYSVSKKIKTIKINGADDLINDL